MAECAVTQFRPKGGVWDEIDRQSDQLGDPALETTEIDQAEGSIHGEQQRSLRDERWWPTLGAVSGENRAELVERLGGSWRGIPCS